MVLTGRTARCRAGIPGIPAEWGIIITALEEVSYEKEHYFMDGGFGGSYAGVSVVCGYFRKRRCRNGGMFSSVFAVNPLYSVLIGAFSGKDIRHLWSLPVISAVLFLIGTWIFFDMGRQHLSCMRQFILPWG